MSRMLIRIEKIIKANADKIALLVFILFIYFTIVFGSFISEKPIVYSEADALKIIGEIKNKSIQKPIKPIGYTTSNVTLLKTYQRSAPYYYTYIKIILK